MNFSERIGKKQPKQIQIDSIDNDLRNSLWNIISLHILPSRHAFSTSYKSGGYNELINKIWFSFLKEPIDFIPYSTQNVFKLIRDRFLTWNYLKVYDFIEFLVSNLTEDRDEIRKSFNDVLKSEVSAYRLMNDQLVPITDEKEIESVQNAIENSSSLKLIGVNIHLKNALDKLSDRASPDYRNSIKESISAVESMCQMIVNDNKAELSKALKAIKKVIPIHSALEQAFIKIYGYSSDGEGIRHALSDEPNLDQEDALYMLISCSAFINYLLVKSNKAGIIVN